MVGALLFAACSGTSQARVAASQSASPSLEALSSGLPTAVSARATDARPSEAPATLIERLSAQGVYCVECELFWNAVGLSVLPPASPDPVKAEAGRRAWLQMRLSTASGGTITFADFAGRPLVIEMMATWCAACADQQDTLRQARGQLPPDAAVISLSVDPRDDAAALGKYAADRGYDWVFGSGSIELLRSLGAQLGDAALDPAVTPIVVIDRAGKVVLAPTGHKDVATLVALVGA